MLIQPFERREFCIECFLERGILAGGDALVVSLLEEIWKGLVDGSRDIEPD
jgi:hypothetical protein